MSLKGVLYDAAPRALHSVSTTLDVLEPVLTLASLNLSVSPAQLISSSQYVELQTDEPVAAGKGKKGSKDEGKGKKKKQ